MFLIQKDLPHGFTDRPFSDIHEVNLERSRRSLVILAAKLIFTLNIFRFYPDALDGWLKVFWFDFFVLGAIFLVVLPSGVLRERVWRPDLLLYSLFFVAVLVALSFTSANAGGVTELGRISYIVLCLVVLVAPWAAHSCNIYDDLARIVYWSIPFMAVLFLLQLFPASSATTLVHLLYGTEKLRDAYSFSPRVYGSFFNANWAAVYLMVAWSVLVWKWQHKRVSLFGAVAMGTLLVFMTLATGSRTGLIGIILITVWLWATGFLIAESLPRQAGVMILAVLFVFIGLSIYSLGILPEAGRYVEVLGAGEMIEVGSVASRFDTWRVGWEHFLKAPLMGPGMDGIPHNSGISWLQSFGIFGAAALSMVMLALVRGLVKLGRTPEVQLSSAVALGFIVMAQTAEFIFVTQILLLIVPFVFGVLFLGRSGA